MLLRTRRRRRRLRHAASTRRRSRAPSRLVSRLTGYPVQPNKAIVGRNAFAHESGIHQDGVLKERTTYEIMDARSSRPGRATTLVLGKHSGRHALRQALEDLGYPVDGAGAATGVQALQGARGQKKQVTAMDLEALVTDELRDEVSGYAPGVVRRRGVHAPAAARDGRGAHAGRTSVVEGSFTGDGPVDAIFRAINTATGVDARLREFRVDAVTGGQDALGEVSVVLELEGRSASGQGVATDILQAAGVAYTRALTVVVHRTRTEAEPALAADAVATP